MQEGLLPNRLLTYTSTQMIWECCEEQRYEKGVRKRLVDVVAQVWEHSNDWDLSLRSGWPRKLDTFMRIKAFSAYRPSNRDSDMSSARETFQLWYDLVEEYSPRTVTNPTDRLLALSGLAKIFGDQRLHNLAWRSTDVSISRLERHLSAIVDMESPEGVSDRYSSPSAGHFTIVQMREDRYSLDLLLLESAGQARDGTRLYRRVGNSHT